MLGLRFCAWAFSSCGERGPLFIVVRGPLTIAASLVAEHRLQTECRLSSCGSRAQLLHGMWDLPRPGLEPVSPALAGRFSTTAPPGKPLSESYKRTQNNLWYRGFWHRSSMIIYHRTSLGSWRQVTGNTSTTVFHVTLRDMYSESMKNVILSLL